MPSPLDTEAILETDRLLLEPLREMHAALLFPLIADPAMYRFIPQQPPSELAALAARYRRLERRSPAQGDEVWLNWALRRKVDETYVGLLQTTLRPRDACAYMAYEVGVRHQRKGYATEACRRLLALLFEQQFDRVIAEVDSRNAASLALLRRLNFSEDGYKENADHFKGGPSHEYRFVMTATQYRQTLDAAPHFDE
jgi:[ribosomal protein S5]-alanine N-acetyltransferase